ncbi:MAG TPA: hypothetical protein VFT90_09155 [Chryseosolibacter sp.]|nr:hypothetical protein [Chryseosolibacter sp.]
MVKIFTSAFILVFANLGAFAQALEFHSLKKLPAAINSVGEESLPLLDMDGGQLFFARALYAGNAGGRFSGMDAWVANASADRWTAPSNNLPAEINNEGHNVIVGLSRDGKKRYFISAHPNQKVNGIYVTTRINNYWSRPEFIPVPGIDNQNFLGVYVSPDFDVMIFSMKGEDSRGDEDLYFSVKSSTGQWSIPKNMGATLNTRGYEISPYLSDDKKRLYFASNGHGGEGDADIFYSERLYNSWETWSLPVNLGKAVNSTKFDAYFSIYGDSVAYFASNRDGRYADIYQIDVALGKSVLAKGQRYLSESEWNRELGGAVSNEVVFSGRATELNAAQKELLFYIANKLQLQKSILFHVIATEEQNPSLTTSRLESIKEHLVQSGIGEERIITEQIESPKQSTEGKFRIRLIE